MTPYYTKVLYRVGDYLDSQFTVYELNSCKVSVSKINI